MSGKLVARLHSQLLLLLLLLALTERASSSDPFQHIHRNVRSSASAAQQSRAAKAVIARTIGPARAYHFHVKVNLLLPRNTFHIQRTAGINRVHITASSGTAACKGFHHYLKHYCNCHLSWDGHQLERLPRRLPLVDHRETAASSVMYYQNVCTYAYSFAWWKWPDWRRHIDWMALNGITLSLAPVQELVWTTIYRELGMTEADIDAHFAGPAFFAWQRMGNLRGWGGPLSERFKRESSALQEQVIEAERELGMSVALPAFAGHVPVAFARLFPNSSFTLATRWNNFSDAQCCPLFIDPVDDLFQTIGQMFLRRIVDLYGSDNHIYFSDPFNELLPASAESDYLTSASRGIFNAMQSVDPEAVWLLQGWMFVNDSFTYWSPEMAQAFLTAVPTGRMLVLDLQSETQPQYERLQSYYGQPWVWCMLHNFGGTLGMHGSVEVVNSQISAASRMPNSTMIGFGLTMEGINQNYVMYEFALERGWDHATVSADSWFDQYATTRYGHESKELQAAWQSLRTSVYSYAGSHAIWEENVVCYRPGLDLEIDHWYNFADLENSLRRIINGSSKARVNSLLHNDLVDIARQFLQFRVDLSYQKLMAALKANDLEQFTNTSADFSAMLHSLDEILATDRHFLLGNWLQQAHRWAHSAAEKQLYDLNARNQITLWGPNGEIHDYAMKQWAGIVSDYCAPRWELFFEDAIAAMKAGVAISMQTFDERVLQMVEKPFTVASGKRSVYTTDPRGDALQVAQGILKRWAGNDV